MKYLILIMVVCGFISVKAQNIEFKEGTRLTYSAKDGSEEIAINTLIRNLTGNLAFDWEKTNKYKDKGTILMTDEAQKKAINYRMQFPISKEPITMYDQVPMFILSNKMFKELKSKNKTQIRMDCAYETHDLIFSIKEKLKIKLNGTETTLDVLKCVYGPYSDEIWVLDNEKLPLVIKVKSIQAIELKEVQIQ